MSEVFLDPATQGCPITAHAARESSLCYFVGCHVRYRSLTTPRGPLNLLPASSRFTSGMAVVLHSTTAASLVHRGCRGDDDGTSWTTALRRQLRYHCISRVYHNSQAKPNHRLHHYRPPVTVRSDVLFTTAKVDVSPCTQNRRRLTFEHVVSGMSELSSNTIMILLLE